MVWQKRFLLAVSVFGGSLSPALLFADNLEFFDRDSAKTVFNSDVEVRVAKYKEPAQPQTDNPAKTEEAAVAPEKQEAALQTNYESPESQRKEKEQEIISKYGDPDSKPKIRTVDNAPPEFKCMMEALDNGLDELAYRCAKKWKLGMANLANLTNKVGSIMPEVDKELGATEDGKAVIDEQGLANKVLSEKAKEILKQAEEDIRLSKKGSLSEIVPESGGNIDRATLHQALVKSGKVPVDPQGKVNVLFFVDPADITSDRMTQQIEALRRSQSGDPRVTVVAVTMTKPLPGAARDFKSRNHTTIHVSDGSELAGKLGVERAPTTVFMSPNLKRAVMEDGFKTWAYMDELVQVMKGGR